MSALLADIAHGHVDLADVMFLLAVIFGVAAALVSVPGRPPGHAAWSPVFGWLAVSALGLGLLLL